MSQASELSEVIKLGAALSEPRSVESLDSTKYVLVPSGYEIRSLEHFKNMPDRVRANPQFDCVKGFAAYVNEFKGEASKMFVKLNDTGLTAVAILDYHDSTDPSWCSWSASLKRGLSKEWVIWRASAGKWMPQIEMAEFLQDNAPDVVDPPGAEMLELCTTFRQVTAVEFGSGYNIQNGAVQLSYVETVGGASGAKGNLQIPPGFTIQVPVLDRGGVVNIACRFRYRISDKKLLLRQDIPQVHKVLDVVMSAAVAELERLTKLQAFLGQP